MKMPTAMGTWVKMIDVVVSMLSPQFLELFSDTSYVEDSHKGYDDVGNVSHDECCARVHGARKLLQFFKYLFLSGAGD